MTAESPDEAVDVFLRRDEADAAPTDCLRDEPGWVEVLSVVPLELDERYLSAN